MPSIVDFLNARLDEEEAVARKAATQTSQSGNRGPGEWWVKDGEPDSKYSSSVGGCRVYTSGDQGSNLTWSLASIQHIADHDPARVLREITAKRRLMSGHERDDWFEGDNEQAGSCDRCSSRCQDCWSFVAWPCGTLKALAAVYAGHPDYDHSWG